jgi:hypothetical protein
MIIMQKEVLNLAFKWIKNNTQVDQTWVGQLINPGSYYQIQPVEEVRWVGDSSLLTAIGSSEAVVAKSDSGSDDFSDVNDAISYLKDIISKLDSEGAQLVRIKGFNSAEGFRFRGKGITGIALAESSSNIDHKLTEEMWINGAQLLCDNLLIGDYVDLQIVDVDGIYAPAGTVLDEFASNWYISGNEQNQGIVRIEYPAKVLANLYLRIKYTSTGPNDVSVYCNLFLHKKA